MSPPWATCSSSSNLTGFLSNFLCCLLSTVPSCALPFPTNPSSPSSPEPDLCHLNVIALLCWETIFLSRKCLQVKGGSNHGAHSTCFHVLREHSPALPVFRLCSCLCWQGYSDPSYSVTVRRTGCSWADFTLDCSYSYIYLSTLARLKALQGQSLCIIHFCFSSGALHTAYMLFIVLDI